MGNELNLLWKMFALGVSGKKNKKILLTLNPPERFYYKKSEDESNTEFVLISDRYLDFICDNYDEDLYPNNILEFDTLFLMNLLQIYNDSLSEMNFKYEDNCFLLSDFDKIIEALNQNNILVLENKDIDLEEFGIYDFDEDDEDFDYLYD